MLKHGRYLGQANRALILRLGVEAGPGRSDAQQDWPRLKLRVVAGLSPYLDYGCRWRQIRQHFGITGFGVNANEAAGEELVVSHKEVSYGGQQEVYLIVRRRARSTCEARRPENRRAENAT